MSKKAILTVVAIIALALVAVVATFVLSRDKGKDDGGKMVTGEPKTELYERMHDKEYIRELKAQEEKTNDAFGEAAEIKRQLEAAKEAGDEEAVAKLKEAQKAALEKLQNIRLETQAKVRAQILKETEKAK